MTILTILLKKSYQQITQWELLDKSNDFSTNIANLFCKLLNFISKKL
jgi:hypothetical protein